MGSYIASWGNIDFDPFLIPKLKGLIWFQMSLAGYEICVVTKFNEQLMAKRFQTVIRIEPLGVHGWVFWDCERFWKDAFLDWQKVCPKFKIQRLWQTNWKNMVCLVGVSGRGGVPGKRKSWGFEDCMYLLSGSPRRTHGVGGSMATASSAELQKQKMGKLLNEI